MANYSVTLKGVKEAIHDLAEIGRFKPLTTLLHKAGLVAQRTARMEAPKDTSGLRRSLALDVRPFSARVYTDLVHAPVMEYGRRPGAKMPPPSALEGWVRRHWGVRGEKAIRSASFVLARSIKRRGIKGRFFMRKAELGVIAAMPGLLTEMKVSIEKQLRSR